MWYNAASAFAHPRPETDLCRNCRAVAYGRTATIGPYQHKIVERTVQAVADRHQNILIESATGSGKTLMALMAIQALHEKYGWTAGWTAMRKHLIHQAAEENKNTLNLPYVQFFSTFNDHPPEGIDILVEDEGHHSASATSVELYKTLKPKLHLGLTATPFRTDRMKLCFSTVIKDAGIRALIDQGFLAPYHQYVYHGEWDPATVAMVYLSDRERWGKSVGFFLTEDECQRCADLIREGGVRCEVVTGSSNQEEQIEAFNHGDVQVLLNMVVLTEGFDSPILKTVFIRPGSKGPTIQMGGRVFRKHADKPTAQIVQSNRSKWPFVRIASSERKFICDAGGAWEERANNERVRQAQRATITAIAATNVSMPQYLKKYQKKQNMLFQSND